ncbi:MAG: FAD-dependent oxidoreductase [Elainellaceae cyanobacterium]
MPTDAASNVSRHDSTTPSAVKNVVIIGCGIIGATIAYELSHIPGLHITVLDRQRPATESTGAALGVLMGAISQKKKGRAWAMRDASLRRYATLIPELESTLGRSLPVNRDGIVLIQFDESGAEETPHETDAVAERPALWNNRWQPLVELRQSQGWTLECWDQEQLRSRCPQIGDCLGDRPIVGAVYSPQDLQINPVALTEALVEAAQINGVQFDFAAPVTALATHDPRDQPEISVVGDLVGDRQSSINLSEQKSPSSASNSASNDSALQSPPYLVHTPEQQYDADWVIMSAGLGSAQLTQSIHKPLDVRPVLGQAVRLHVPTPMGQPEFQPVISGHDIHIVPLGAEEYWVGATVEFPDDAGEVCADETLLQEVLTGAIALCPALAEATIIEHWSGQRPRPWNQAAPVIEPVEGYPQVWLATAHYRNGVLLAPATAQIIRSVLESA